MIEKLDEEKLLEVIEILDALEEEARLALCASLELNDRAQALSSPLTPLTLEGEKKAIEICYLLEKVSEVLHS